MCPTVMTILGLVSCHLLQQRPKREPTQCYPDAPYLHVVRNSYEIEQSPLSSHCCCFSCLLFSSDDAFWLFRERTSKHTYIIFSVLQHLPLLHPPYCMGSPSPPQPCPQLFSVFIYSPAPSQAHLPLQPVFPLFNTILPC